jgi:hypothetical protein
MNVLTAGPRADGAYGTAEGSRLPLGKYPDRYAIRQIMVAARHAETSHDARNISATIALFPKKFSKDVS